MPEPEVAAAADMSMIGCSQFVAIGNTTAVSLDCCRNIVAVANCCYHSTTIGSNRNIIDCSDRSTVIAVAETDLVGSNCFSRMRAAAFEWYFCDRRHPS